jgi:hypothetical protein
MLAGSRSGVLIVCQTGFVNGEARWQSDSLSNLRRHLEALLGCGEELLYPQNRQYFILESHGIRNVNIALLLDSTALEPYTLEVTCFLKSNCTVLVRL